MFVDMLSYFIVTVLTIGGIILAIVTFFRGRKKRRQEDYENEQIVFALPEKLKELPGNDYIVLPKQYLMTKLGSTRADQIIVSPHGVFCLEFTVTDGKISGVKDVQTWYKTTLAGFGQKRFTSPLWRANVNIVTLRDMFPELKDVPMYPMAVFPDETKLDDDLSLYDFVEDEDDYEEYDDDDVVEDIEDEEVEDDEEYEDDYIEIDDTLFVGHLSQVVEFITYHTNDAMSMEDAKRIAKEIQKNSEKVLAEKEEEEEHEDEDSKDKGPVLLPEEYLPFTRDYVPPRPKPEKGKGKKGKGKETADEADDTATDGAAEESAEGGAKE